MKHVLQNPGITATDSAIPGDMAAVAVGMITVAVVAAVVAVVVVVVRAVAEVREEDTLVIDINNLMQTAAIR